MIGFLLIDKPAGITSHDVVNRVRRLTGERRVGHAGTLDPFATGLLLVAVGREATRELSKFVGLDKTYEAEFILGAHSDTDDVEGVIKQVDGPHTWSTEQIKEALQTFVGEIQQLPPTYSAIKIGGTKMYEAARAGTPLTAAPRTVTISSIELHATHPIPDSYTQSVTLTIHCSSGTYIRAIARDLGATLNTGGYVKTLRRTRIGPFSIANATTLESIHLLPKEDLLNQL